MTTITDNLTNYKNYLNEHVRTHSYNGNGLDLLQNPHLITTLKFSLKFVNQHVNTVILINSDYNVETEMTILNLLAHFLYLFINLNYLHIKIRDYGYISYYSNFTNKPPSLNNIKLGILSQHVNPNFINGLDILQVDKFVYNYDIDTTFLDVYIYYIKDIKNLYIKTFTTNLHTINILACKANIYINFNVKNLCLTESNEFIESEKTKYGITQRHKKPICDYETSTLIYDTTGNLHESVSEFHMDISDSDSDDIVVEDANLFTLFYEYFKKNCYSNWDDKMMFD